MAHDLDVSERTTPLPTTMPTAGGLAEHEPDWPDEGSVLAEADRFAAMVWGFVSAS
ncbi:MAG TPA: hypothetical protein VGM78_15905 [Ilumatobacteraceae bacterium]